MTFRENIEFCNIRSRGGRRGKGWGRNQIIADFLRMKSLSLCYVERMKQEANISRNLYKQGEKIKSFNTGVILATYMLKCI